MGFIIKWIAAFIVAGIVSSLLMAAVLFVAQYIPIPAWLGILLMALVMGAGAFDEGALLYSPVTGLVMAWLLDHPKQQPVESKQLPA